MTPHAVYRMYARDGELLYIGCTDNPARRIESHPNWLVARTPRITLEWHPDKTTGRAAETRAIHAEEPALNIRDHPDKRERPSRQIWRQSQARRVTSGNLWCVAGIHRRRKRPVTDDGYAAMLRRMFGGYEKRIIKEPSALVHLRDLEQALTDATNVGIYAAHLNGHSYTELAGILGVSKAAIIKRAKLGETALRQREKAAASKVRLQLRKAAPRELASGQD